MAGRMFTSCCAFLAMLIVLAGLLYGAFVAMLLSGCDLYKDGPGDCADWVGWGIGMLPVLWLAACPGLVRLFRQPIPGWFWAMVAGAMGLVGLGLVVALDLTAGGNGPAEPVVPTLFRLTIAALVLVPLAATLHVTLQAGRAAGQIG